MNNYDNAIKELEKEIDNIKSLSQLITDVNSIKSDMKSQDERIKKSINDLNKANENINDLNKSLEVSSKNMDSALEEIIEIEKLVNITKNILESEYTEVKKISNKMEILDSDLIEKNDLVLSNLEEIKSSLEKKASKINMLSIIVPLVFIINCIIMFLLIK